VTVTTIVVFTSHRGWYETESGGPCDKQARNHLDTVKTVTSFGPLLLRISPYFGCCSLGDNIVFTKALLQVVVIVGSYSALALREWWMLGSAFWTDAMHLWGFSVFGIWYCVCCSLICGTGVLLQTHDVVVNPETLLSAVVELAIRSQKHLFPPPCRCCWH
jgi:hypothetical protein